MRENSADARIFHSEGTHNVKIRWKYFTICMRICLSLFARMLSFNPRVSV